ncbi:MAG: radical SAM protein [Myxococcales bacterium]|nr:radical SAM protein [Myxococcales bacterium]
MSFTRLFRRNRVGDGRALLGVVGAAIDPRRPVLANLIVTRRCNLSCAYCYEYDKTSPPVCTATLKWSIDHLRRLRVVFVTLTGGETLLHPELPELVAYVRERGMTPLMNTNGYLLTRDRIKALGDAGLYGMQISIDNLTPNETTKKSLKTLLPKLRLLADHAAFRVRVSTVLGAGSPDEAIMVARTALELGFEAKCQLARDEEGALVPLDSRSLQVYEEIRRMGRRSPRYLSEDFQTRLIQHGQVAWKCRAGARYFHVCENGLVHFCSSRHGCPGKPLAEYAEADIRKAFHTPKGCSSTCTQPYAHQISRLDSLRGQGKTRLPILPSQGLGA